MKVLITGGAGFVGSNLAQKLVSQGEEVTIIDNFSFGAERNIEGIKKEVSLVRADIASDPISEHFKGQDVVFHLAAIADARVCDAEPTEAMRTNVQGTFNVLLSSHSNKVGRVIFGSSAYVYGDPVYVPMDEKHPLSLTNTYALSKRLGEKICDYFINKFSVNVFYFRSFNIYGPRQSTAYLVPKLILQALKDKRIEMLTDKPTRDYLFIDDAVDAFLKASESDFKGGPINLGYGSEIGVGSVAEIVASRLGCKAKSLGKEAYGAMRLFCDNRKVMKVLNWKPKTDIETGLAKTIEWYKENTDTPSGFE